MSSKRGNVVSVPGRDQSEIFKTRRNLRRSRINSVHAEVRAIFQGDIKAKRSVTRSENPIIKSN